MFILLFWIILCPVNFVSFTNMFIPYVLFVFNFNASSCSLFSRNSGWIAPQKCRWWWIKWIHISSQVWKPIEQLENPICFWFGSLPPLPGSLQTFYYSVCSIFVSVSPFEFSITSLINIKTPLKSCKSSVCS